MTLSEVHRWWSVQSWWLHLVVAAAVGAVLAGCVETALPEWSIAPAIGPFLIVAGLVFWSSRQFWGLPRPARIAVDGAMRTGISTGNSALDQIAVDRLAARARNRRADQLFAPVGVVVLVGLPVAAAVRSGNAWWLLAVLVLMVQFVSTGGALPRDPWPSLESLTSDRRSSDGG